MLHVSCHYLCPTRPGRRPPGGNRPTSRPGRPDRLARRRRCCVALGRMAACGGEDRELRDDGEQGLCGRRGGAVGRLARRHDDHVGRVWAVRHSRGADRGDSCQRGEGSDGHFQQRRHRRCGVGRPAEDAAGPQDDQFVCRRERNIRATVSGRGVGDRVQPARHAGGADQGGRGWDPGVLHRDRGRDADRRGQGNQAVRRPHLCDGIGAARRPGGDPCLEGGSRGQPDLSEDRAELQSDHGDRGRGDGGRGRGPCRAGADRSGPHHHAGDFRQSHGAAGGG